MSIITSLFDTDFYKFTQQQFIFHRFPDVEVEYTFKCRNDIEFRHLATRILTEIRELCDLGFTSKELDYLKSLGIFKQDYLDFLREFKLNWNCIEFPIGMGKEFELKIKGRWLDTILFETPILAIISELYSRSITGDSDSPLFIHANRFLRDKVAKLHVRMIKMPEKVDSSVKYVDFGTRRRFSKYWHDFLIGQRLIFFPESFIGTSNVMFAKKFGIKPIGTMAHEILQTGQVLAPTLRESQRFILNEWLDEYGDKLGIALTDVITMDAFLKDFEQDQLAFKYSGCRQDSGDPYIWGDKLIAFYERLGIDPKIKTAVFSDGLTFDSMIKINDYFKDRIKVIFGIGTNLTNDVGIESPNIVLKLTKVNGKPVAKISDSPGKSLCTDEVYLDRLRECFGVK